MRPLILALVFVAACGKKDATDGLRFTPDALPEGEVGRPYRAELSVLGGRTPVGGMTADAPPPGLELHFTREATFAVLEGTPTKTGTYTFKASAWCYGTNVSGQTGAHDYRIVVR
jgi:hypothetical protein